jgi:glycerol-3-phosphate dehydrogenase
LNLYHFTNSRWKGQRPVLFGEQLKQSELQEAMYCGLFDLDLSKRADAPAEKK